VGRKVRSRDGLPRTSYVRYGRSIIPLPPVASGPPSPGKLAKKATNSFPLLSPKPATGSARRPRLPPLRPPSAASPRPSSGPPSTPAGASAGRSPGCTSTSSVRKPRSGVKLGNRFRSEKVHRLFRFGRSFRGRMWRQARVQVRVRGFRPPPAVEQSLPGLDSDRRRRCHDGLG
jgi:hypothetical protein